jgi:hypothetical protein
MSYVPDLVVICHIWHKKNTHQFCDWQVSFVAVSGFAFFFAQLNPKTVVHFLGFAFFRSTYPKTALHFLGFAFFSLNLIQKPHYTFWVSL